MSNIPALLSSALLFTVFTACNDDSHRAKEEADRLSHYVDSVNSVTPEYTAAHWDAIDSGYQERLAGLTINESKLKEADRAKAEESKSQYETMKVAYKAKIKESEDKRKANDYRMILRNNLFGEGKVGIDMKLGYVNAKNILGVYENFVNTVDVKKDSYTREDWDEIKVLYEALDIRKNEVEKDLASKDNFKIAKLKIKFATIKALHRGAAKVEENEKSKK